MPNLRDIFRYVNPTAQEHGPGGHTNGIPNSEHPDWAYEGDGGGGEAGMGSFKWSSNASDAFLGDLRKQYGDDVVQQGIYNTDGGGDQGIWFDWSKLPKTRFGDAGQAAAVDQGTDLHNAAYAYDDPNYGRITSMANVKGNDELGMMVKAIMAAATMGIGALGGSAMAIQGVNAGRSIGSGGNPLSSLAGLAGGALGIDPNITQAIKGGLTLSQLAQARRRSGPGKP